LKVNRWPEDELDRKLDRLAKRRRKEKALEQREQKEESKKETNTKEIEPIRQQLLLRHLGEARSSQLQRLGEWENEINGVELTKITVENKVDLEGKRSSEKKK